MVTYKRTNEFRTKFDTIFHPKVEKSFPLADLLRKSKRDQRFRYEIIMRIILARRKSASNI